MVSRRTSSGTRARIASVACCSHSPASGPSAYAPVSTSPSLRRVRKPLDSAYARVYVSVLASSDSGTVALNRASVAPDGCRLRVGVGDAGHGPVVGFARLARGCSRRPPRPGTCRRGSAARCR